MKSYQRVGVILTVVVSLLSYSAVPSVAASKPTEDVVVAYLPLSSFYVLFVALEKGYLQEQGFNIRMERVKSGAEAMAFLSSGQMHVAGSAIVPGAFTAINRGLDLAIVSSAAISPKVDGPDKLIVRKDLYESGKITKLTDLKGKQVAVSGGAGSGGAFIVAQAMRNTPVKVKELNLINIGNPDMFNGLKNKSIDACYVGSPFVKQILDSGVGVVLAQDITAGRMVVSYIMSGKFIKSKREAAVNFMVALLKASRDMQGNKVYSPENMVAYVKWTGSKEEDIRKDTPQIYDPNLRILKNNLVEGEEIVRDAGWVDYTNPLDVNKMIDESILQDALKIVGEVPFQLPK